MVEQAKSAKELAKEHKEISVSEFFEKNRHLLGYDNKIKALLIIVKEGVDNSVEYNEPVLVRENGDIKIVKIGEIIDKKLDGEHIVIKNNEVESAAVEGLEAFVYDDKTFKAGFRPISAVHRHQLHDKLYEITLTGNRKVKVTGSHSVFVLKNSKVKPYPVKDIKEGDYIVVPRKKFTIEGQKKLDLSEWAKELSKKERIMIKGVSSRIKNIPRDWKRFDYIPVDYFIKNNIEVPKNGKINVRFGREGKSALPLTLEITPELMRLLGYYAAEGTCYDQWITLSFGLHEEELIRDAETCIKSLGLSYSRIMAHKTALTLKINSKIFSLFLKDFLKAGSRAYNKTVPNAVFNVSNELQMQFLLAYIAGDGHIGEKITMATISNKLATGLKFLFAINGLPFSEYTKQESVREFRKQYTSICKKVYFLYVYPYGKYAASPLNWMPLEESGFRDTIKELNPKIGSFNPHYRMISRPAFTFSSASSDLQLAQLHKRGSCSAEKIKYLQCLLSGDIGFLKVKVIKETKSECPHVYDFSVPESEKFLGGEGVIFLHNSLDACEESRILPEIYVKLEEAGKEKYRVVIRDNGPGIMKEQIPKIFGTLLYGSKFHRLRQNRGAQGLGISCAVMYSQLTTGEPVEILSSTGDGTTHRYKMKIDVKNNEAVILESEDLKGNKWHGVQITFICEGIYREHKQSVLEYMKESAIANPFANFVFESPTGRMEFKRSSDKLPAEPKEIPPHIKGVEIGVMTRLLEATSARSLETFFTTEFTRIGKTSAEEICKVAGLDPKISPRRVEDRDIVKIVEAVKITKLPNPPTDILSPLGEKLIESGLKKELSPDFVAAISRPPAVYRGFPFIIETAVAYGGSISEPSLMRFANRVPLLYQQGDCAVTKSACTVDWKRYGIDSDKIPSGPVVLFAHICSVWVPFTSESKEAVASYPIIMKEVKLAFQEVARKLSLYLSGIRRAEYQAERMKTFEKYAEETANALEELTGEEAKKIKEMIKKVVEEKAGEIAAAEAAETSAEENKKKKKEDDAVKEYGDTDDE